ncbi:serine hydrolase [Streptomyces sp. SID2563]|uniref:serine hydrolase n=1 Tax=Streptomyces sp. SID2563 TaxID=2690255 RepID=UPI0031FE599E
MGRGRGLPPGGRDRPAAPDAHRRTAPPGAAEEPVRHRPRRCSQRGSARSPQPATRRSRRVHRPGRPHPRLPRRAPLRPTPRRALRGDDLAPTGHGLHTLRPLPADVSSRCAPTELDEDTGSHLKGTAHDFSARLLGGVCGIAGVCTVLDDVAAFLRYMLAPATAPTEAEAGFGAEWTAHSLTVQTGDLQPERGLFWHPAPGTTPEHETWVHYGFTGTGMWISPAQDRWAVLLTNKLYYTRDRQPLAGVRNAFRKLVS